MCVIGFIVKQQCQLIVSSFQLQAFAPQYCIGIFEDRSTVLPSWIGKLVSTSIVSGEQDFALASCNSPVCGCNDHIVCIGQVHQIMPVIDQPQIYPASASGSVKRDQASINVRTCDFGESTSY